MTPFQRFSRCLRFISYSTLVSGLFWVALTSGLYASTHTAFESSIFTYDDPEHARGLHMGLSGITATEAPWTAREGGPNDFEFLQKIWAHPDVMKSVGDGKVKAPKAALDAIKRQKVRVETGSPLGMMFVRDATATPFMYAFTRATEEEGACEIGYGSLPSHWGQKYTQSVVKNLVETWAPEVARIGRGIGLNPQAHQIQKAFTCFHEKPLEQLVATAKPTNIGSQCVLEKAGFKPVILEDETNVLDFENKAETVEDLDAQLLSRFQDSKNGGHLKPNTLYQLIGPNGKLQAVSYQTDYESLRFHFACTVPQPAHLSQ